MKNGLLGCLASLGLALIAQAAWLAVMLHAASVDPNKTVGGAYCAMWMLGIPVVFLASLTAGMLLHLWSNR